MTAGVSMSHIPVSLMMAMSAAKAWRCSARNGSRLRLPTSSSPSISTVAGQGGPPATSCQARNASSHIITWPLSSTAPRAQMRGPCGPSRSTSTAPVASADASAPASGAKTIGVSIQNREAQFYQDMESGMKTEAAKYGYTVTVVDASRDNSKQQSQVEDFISQKVAAIVLTPYDSQAIGSAIVEANDAHVPVFTADIANGSKQGKVVAHIASDNVQGGAQAAKLLCAAVGSGGTVAIVDEPEVSSVQDRVSGFKAGLASGCPTVKVVADIDGGGERAKASSVDGRHLAGAQGSASGVFGINDDSALGAVARDRCGRSRTAKIVRSSVTTRPLKRARRSRSRFDVRRCDPASRSDRFAKTIDAIHAYFFAGKNAAREDRGPRRHVHEGERKVG